MEAGNRTVKELQQESQKSDCQGDTTRKPETGLGRRYNPEAGDRTGKEMQSGSRKLDYQGDTTGNWTGKEIQPGSRKLDCEGETKRKPETRLGEKEAGNRT